MKYEKYYLGDMVFGIILTNIEKEYTLHKIIVGVELNFFSFPLGIYEVREKNNLKSILPGNIKIATIAIDFT